MRIWLAIQALSTGYKSRQNIASTRRVSLYGWVLLAVMQMAGGLHTSQAQEHLLPSLDPTKQITQYVHDVWQKKDGLPHPHIRAIIQTPDGYLWLATSGGLVRFDGVQFTPFTTENTPALPDNDLHHLRVTSDSSLWIGSNGGGLIRYKHHQFRTYTTTDGLASNRIQALFVDRKGTLWIAAGSEGLHRFQDETFSFLPVPEPIQEILAITEDLEGGSGSLPVRLGFFATEKENSAAIQRQMGSRVAT